MPQTEFTQEQFEAIYPSGIGRHYWTLARNLIIKRELIRNSLRGKRLLEIGCGRGIVVDFLRQSDFDCYGVELAPVDPLSKITQYIYSGMDFTNLDQKFIDSIEVILLFDVIEHLANEQDFLNRIRKIFPKVKYLIMTVPARMELWSNYDTFNGHLRRYDLQSLKQSVENCSWMTTSSRYFFHLLYLPAWLLLHFSGQRQTKIVPPTGLAILGHKLLAYLFVFDSILFPNRCSGTSIISTLVINEDRNKI